MKKNAFFIACCIGLMLLASCKKNIAPTITLFQGEGYLTENAQIYATDEVSIGFVVTGEKLTKLETTVTKNGTFVCSYPIYIEETNTYTGTFHISLEVTGTVTITGTVTDATGQTASTSFNIIVNEKPNAKFIGHYEGNALATGSMETEMIGMEEPFQDEFTDREVPVVLDLYAGENINEVIGSCKFDDRTVECMGVVEGNVVTFEATNEAVTFDYDINGFNISLNLNMNYSIKGTLTTDGKLAINGTYSGEGSNMFVSIKIDTTIDGSLNKKN